jgi:hypothetical protein
MTYFDDAAAYWGGTREKIVDYNRLTARSVKMFADGRILVRRENKSLKFSLEQVHCARAMLQYV